MKYRCDICNKYVNKEALGVSGGIILEPKGYGIEREIVYCAKCTKTHGPCIGDHRAAKYTNWINPNKALDADLA